MPGPTSVLVGGLPKESTYLTFAIRQNENIERKFQEHAKDFGKQRNLAILDDETRIWDVKFDSKGKVYRPISTAMGTNTSATGSLGQEVERKPLSYKKLQKLTELTYKCPQIGNVKLYRTSQHLNQVMLQAEKNQLTINRENQEKANSRKACKIYKMQGQKLPFPLMKPSLEPADVRRQVAQAKRRAKILPLQENRLAIMVNEASQANLGAVSLDSMGRPSHEEILRRLETKMRLAELRNLGSIEKLKRKFIMEAVERDDKQMCKVTDHKVITAFHESKRMLSRGMEVADTGPLPGDDRPSVPITGLKGLVLLVMRLLRVSRMLSGGKKPEIKWGAVRKRMSVALLVKSSKKKPEGSLGAIQEQPTLDAMRNTRYLRFSDTQAKLVNSVVFKEPISEEFKAKKSGLPPLHKVAASILQMKRISAMTAQTTEQKQKLLKTDI